MTKEENGVAVGEVEKKLYYYKVVNCPGFNGLMVSSYYSPEFVTPLPIVGIYDSHTVMGDRELKWQVDGNITMNRKCLELIATPFLPEFSSKSPYGEFLYESTFEKGEYKIAYAEYKNIYTVSVRKKTGSSSTNNVFSQNFPHGKGGEKILSLIVNMLRESTVEDLVFELGALHSGTKPLNVDYIYTNERKK